MFPLQKISFFQSLDWLESVKISSQNKESTQNIKFSQNKPEQLIKMTDKISKIDVPMWKRISIQNTMGNYKSAPSKQKSLFDSFSANQFADDARNKQTMAKSNQFQLNKKKNKQVSPLVKFNEDKEREESQVEEIDALEKKQLQEFQDRDQNNNHLGNNLETHSDHHSQISMFICKKNEVSIKYDLADQGLQQQQLQQKILQSQQSHHGSKSLPISPITKPNLNINVDETRQALKQSDMKPQYSQISEINKNEDDNLQYNKQLSQLHQSQCPSPFFNYFDQGAVASRSQNLENKLNRTSTTPPLQHIQQEDIDDNNKRDSNDQNDQKKEKQQLSNQVIVRKKLQQKQIKSAQQIKQIKKFKNRINIQRKGTFQPKKNDIQKQIYKLGIDVEYIDKSFLSDKNEGYGQNQQQDEDFTNFITQMQQKQNKQAENNNQDVKQDSLKLDSNQMSEKQTKYQKKGSVHNVEIRITNPQVHSDHSSSRKQQQFQQQPSILKYVIFQEQNKENEKKKENKQKNIQTKTVKRIEKKVEFIENDKSNKRNIDIDQKQKKSTKNLAIRPLVQMAIIPSNPSVAKKYQQLDQSKKQQDKKLQNRYQKKLSQQSQHFESLYKQMKNQLIQVQYQRKKLNQQLENIHNQLKLFKNIEIPKSQQIKLLQKNNEQLLVEICQLRQKVVRGEQNMHMFLGKYGVLIEQYQNSQKIQMENNLKKSRRTVKKVEYQNHAYEDSINILKEELQERQFQIQKLQTEKNQLYINLRREKQRVKELQISAQHDWHQFSLKQRAMESQIKILKYNLNEVLTKKNQIYYEYFNDRANCQSFKDSQSSKNYQGIVDPQSNRYHNNYLSKRIERHRQNSYLNPQQQSGLTRAIKKRNQETTMRLSPRVNRIKQKIQAEIRQRTVSKESKKYLDEIKRQKSRRILNQVKKDDLIEQNQNIGYHKNKYLKNIYVSPPVSPPSNYSQAILTKNVTMDQVSQKLQRLRADVRRQLAKDGIRT